MTMLDRRTLLAGAALPLFAIGSGRARAAEFNLKLANNAPMTHPQTIRQQEAIDRIKTATNGQVEIQLFPNNQLGSDTDMLSQLRSGAIDFFTLSGLVLATLVPPASINGIGFAFKDYDTVWQAMDGKLGAHVRAEIDKRGLIAMDKMWDNGFRQITSSTHPIKEPVI
jgi:TRAP-type C4-dicarboxylate transport system substrate-binding protein